MTKWIFSFFQKQKEKYSTGFPKNLGTCLIKKKKMFYWISSRKKDILSSQTDFNFLKKAHWNLLSVAFVDKAIYLSQCWILLSFMTNYSSSKDWDKPRNSYYLQLRKVAHINKSESPNGMTLKRLAWFPLKDCPQAHGQKWHYVFLENKWHYSPERTFWKAGWPKRNERNRDVGEKGCWRGSEHRHVSEAWKGNVKAWKANW